MAYYGGRPRTAPQAARVVDADAEAAGRSAVTGLPYDLPKDPPPSPGRPPRR